MIPKGTYNCFEHGLMDTTSRLIKFPLDGQTKALCPHCLRIMDMVSQFLLAEYRQSENVEINEDILPSA